MNTIFLVLLLAIYWLLCANTLFFYFLFENDCAINSKKILQLFFSPFILIFLLLKFPVILIQTFIKEQRKKKKQLQEGTKRKNEYETRWVEDDSDLPF